MKDALDVVMAWQLRNPSTTDPTEAIAAVRKARDSDSELPQRLATHFLKLTIPPLFPQPKSTNTFEVLPKDPPWKEPQNEYALGLLDWSVKSLDRRLIEQNWHLIVPPILQILDDTAVESKAIGCHHLNQLLLTLELGSDRDVSAAFLARTGYHEVFASALWPLLTYIPSLTPESESVTIFQSVCAPLCSLAVLVRPEDKRAKFVDKIMRESVLAPLSHFPTPSTYPDLACEIIRQINEITALMGIEAVKHLPSLIPLLTSIMQDPFVLSHKTLALASVQGLQCLVQVCWPRLPAHRGAITLGLCVLKGRCDLEFGREVTGKEGTEDWVMMRDLREEVKATAELVNAVLSQSEASDEWNNEKASLADVDKGLVGFFEGRELDSDEQ